MFLLISLLLIAAGFLFFVAAYRLSTFSSASSAAEVASARRWSRGCFWAGAVVFTVWIALIVVTAIVNGYQEMIDASPF